MYINQKNGMVVISLTLGSYLQGATLDTTAVEEQEKDLRI